jgi:hypothetical protein
VDPNVATSHWSWDAKCAQLLTVQRQARRNPSFLQTSNHRDSLAYAIKHHGSLQLPGTVNRLFNQQVPCYFDRLDALIY